mgnify:CR=1 FL=1
MAARKRSFVLHISPLFLETVRGGGLLAASMFEQHNERCRRRPLNTVTFFHAPTGSKSKKIYAVVHAEGKHLYLHLLHELPPEKIVELQKRSQIESTPRRPARRPRTPRK